MAGNVQATRHRLGIGNRLQVANNRRLSFDAEDEQAPVEGIRDFSVEEDPIDQINLSSLETVKVALIFRKIGRSRI